MLPNTAHATYLKMVIHLYFIDTVTMEVFHPQTCTNVGFSLEYVCPYCWQSKQIAEIGWFFCSTVYLGFTLNNHVFVVSSLDK